MSDRLALPRRYRDQLEALLRQHVPGVEVWAYGSRVNGESHDGSDLDLALRGPALEPLDGGYYDLLEAIEKSNIPILIQAHDWAMLPEGFHREIKRDYVVVQDGVGKQTTAGEWCEVTLGEVLTLQRGFDLPTTQRKPGSYPVIASTGPVGTHGEAMVRGPGVVIGRSGSLGGGQFVEHDFWPLNTTLWVKDFKGNDPRFCYYLLKSIDLAQFNVGSGVPTLNRNHIHPFPVARPPLPTQRAIAHVLGTLDDKIELNRRMSETLEAMARALFKSWFVDFDPVRAKMEGHWQRGESLPGLPAEHYDLFPDRLVDSELGEVPEGWDVKALESLLETLETGYRPPGGVSGIVSGIPSVGAESIEQVGVFDFSKTKYVPLDFYNGMKRGVVEEGDVLIYKDGGRPGELEPAVTYISQGFPFSAFCINEHVYRVRTKRFSQQLLYCYLTTSAAFWQMRELATGVAQPGLNRRAVESIAITVPADNRLLSAWQEKIGPLLDECNINGLESLNLSQIRDALLPRLVSGEVEVRDTTQEASL